MGVFNTRPRFDDTQIKQLTGDTITLSGTTNISGTFRYIPGATTGNFLKAADPQGTLEWAPISAITWAISACTSPLYVSTIEACPNPTDPLYIEAGEVQFGTSPNSIITDITNTRVGIGTGSPSVALDVQNGDILVENSNGMFETNLNDSAGALVRLTGDSTSLTRIAISSPPDGGISIGHRGLTEAGFPGYGKQGDGFLYSSEDENGLNIISQPGTGTDDYIRFYAGDDANGTTANLYIQGSGSTKGNVGINNESPTEKLHIISAVEANIKVEADTGNVDETKNANILLTQDGGVSTARFGMSPDGINDLLIGVNSTTAPSIKFATRSDGTSFSTTADTKVTISNAGNMGIGTETPTEKLHVEGSVRIVDGTEQNGYVLTCDANGVGSWQPSTSGGTGGGVTIDPYNDVGTTTTINWDVSGTSTNYEATLNGNGTLNLLNVRNGDYGTIIVEQDGVGGHTLAFGTINGGAGTHKVVNGGSGAPTLTVNANAIDILSFTYNGSTMYWTVGNDYT